MLGTYDFCAHYEWTFEWLRQQAGEALVREYWDAAIYRDSQLHATALIRAEGIEGMKKYWAHTLEEEAAGYHCTATETVYRIDMLQCPSKGFLIRNSLEQYHDYCDHCIGWIGPLMREAGFTIDHEHNHCGQCWWEMRQTTDLTPPSASAELSGSHDVRLRPDWTAVKPIDVFARATAPEEKQT